MGEAATTSVDVATQGSGSSLREKDYVDATQVPVSSGVDTMA